MLRMKLIQGMMIFWTGVYQAIRKATGRDVMKPRPKPAATHRRLLLMSFQKAPLSIMVWMAGITLSRKGKLRPVVLPRDRKYHSSRAAQREISSQSLSLITRFFFVVLFI